MCCWRPGTEQSAEECLDLRRKKWQEGGNAHTMTFRICSPPVITRTIKSKVIRWVGHATRTGEMRNAQRVVVGKSEGRRRLEYKALLGWQQHRIGKAYCLEHTEMSKVTTSAGRPRE
jgi:hypothetical protein